MAANGAGTRPLRRHRSQTQTMRAAAGPCAVCVAVPLVRDLHRLPVMRLQQIMKTPVETIAPDALVAAARAQMRRERIHHLVVTKGREVVGVLSARDLGGAAPDATVESLMRGEVATAAPSTTVREAANLLRGRGIGCLPIVQRGRPVGMVTITDLLELIGRGVERPTPKSVRWTLRARGPRKGRPSEDRQGLAYSR